MTKKETVNVTSLNPSGKKAMGSIGIFDSGIGGLTVLKEIARKLPQYDYIYLGDSARAPYGIRSFDTVYQYTLECVQKLFEMNCELIILACNTASAKALRNIQQLDLNRIAPGPEGMPSQKRVLGVIRPTSEIVGKYSLTKKVGVLGTSGTVLSNSYKIEIGKSSPEVTVYQQACPLWVPIIENNEIDLPTTDILVKKYLDELFTQSPEGSGINIDTIILGCTHYPLLLDKIKKYVPPNVKIISQGEIVANSLANYLTKHTEIESKLSKKGTSIFFTTDSSVNFDKIAGRFWGGEIRSKHITL